MPDDHRFERYLENFDVAARVAAGPVNAHWLEDGSSFCLAIASRGGVTVVQVDPVSETVTELPSVKPTNSGSLPSFELNGRAIQVDDSLVVRVEPLKDSPAPRVLRTDPFRGSPDVLELPSPNGELFVGMCEHNAYIRHARDDQVRFLTDDGTEAYGWEIQNSHAPRPANAQWSPEGGKVAVFKTDLRGMSQTILVHWLNREEKADVLPYARPGDPVAETELHVLRVDGGAAVQIDTGPVNEQMLDVLGWHPGGELLFIHASRDLRTRTVRAANPTTGQSRVVLSETSDGVFNYLNWWGACTPLPSGDGFIWWSDRDGHGQLYRYDWNGTLCAKLTDAPFSVADGLFRHLAIDEERRVLFYSGRSDRRVTDTHLYCVDFDGANRVRLTNEDGHHEVQVSPSKAFFIDNHSSVDRPPRVDLRRVDGTLLRTVCVSESNSSDEEEWRCPEEFVVNAADGETELHGLLFTPPDFDPDKAYPVVDAIYGGPQLQIVRPMYADPVLGHMARTPAQALAQLGFVTMMVDGRGTPGRGARFQNAVQGNFGRYEIADHLAALDQLSAARPYMDIDRVGITGRSWGGYMAIRGMLLAPDVYRVGVALYPVCDALDQGARPVECFMGLPSENPEGYEHASCLPLVSKLAGKLLILHGTNDLNAPFSSTMKLADALVRADKEFDMVVLPEESHVLTSQATAYFYKRMGSYLQEHLHP